MFDTCLDDENQYGAKEKERYTWHEFAFVLLMLFDGYSCYGYCIEILYCDVSKTGGCFIRHMTFVSATT